MPSNVRVNIEKFRAINKANIKIDGITLVAGENGCGKSTLSKLLYYFYKNVSEYEDIVKRQLFQKLSRITLFINITTREIKIPQKDRREILDETTDFDKTEEEWLNFIDKIELLFRGSEDLRDDVSKSSRISRITQDLLGEDFSENNQINFTKIKEFITNQFKEANGKIASRPASLFKNELKSVFSNSNLPDTFEVYELDDMLVSLKKDTLSIPYTIQKTIYIDTPMMISIESKNTHWNDLNELLAKSKEKIGSNDIMKIIRGDAYVEEELFEEEFKYKRLDGKTFDLLDVATGIKAFSILQLLLKGGHLTSKTLLIIDEPESNLHPQ